MDIHKKTFIWLHLIWFLFWGGTLLFMSLPSGHMPIVFFAGYPLVMGFFGHLFLFFVNFLFNLNKKHGVAANQVDNSWPWPLIIALVVFAYVVFYQIILSNFYHLVLIKVMSLYMNVGPVEHSQAQRGVPFIYLIMSFSTIIISLLGIYGIITRTKWCYKLIQGLCFFIAIAILFLLIYSFIIGNVAMKIFITLPILAALFSAYIYLFSTSVKVKQFFQLE